MPRSELEDVPLKGIILSGGPYSVYDEAAPHVHEDVWKLIEERKLPVLGICYGMQEIAHVLGGKVAQGEKREYGKSTAKKVQDAKDGGLLAGLPDESQVSSISRSGNIQRYMSLDVDEPRRQDSCLT